MDKRQLEVEFLLKDYDQAWSHYRHIEDARSRYLGFFFTASLGSTAIAAPLVAAADISVGLKLVVAVAFIAVFEVFTYFVFVAIHRFGWVLSHYEAVMRESRRRRATLGGIPVDSERMVDPRYSSPQLSWMFSVHRTAEVTLIGFLVGGMLFAIPLGVVAIERDATLTMLLCGFAAVLATVTTASAIIARSSGAEPPRPFGQR